MSENKVTDFIVDKDALDKANLRNPFVNIQCVNSGPPAAAGAPSMLQQIIDFVKSILHAVIIVIVIVIVVGCGVFAFSGKQAFEDYWNYNIKVIGKIITASESAVDKLIPD
jgi:type IV secretory pathway VirB2 component (pilin)